jgi:monoamine oxidase
MSYLSFKPSFSPAPIASGSLRTAFARFLLANHGAPYHAAVSANRTRAHAHRLHAQLAAASPSRTSEEPMVGIVGGGFAGLFSGLILQSLGIGCEVFERSDRVGGRIHTWYSSDYAPNDPDSAGLYGELGGMRLPQFSADMLPVQQVALAVNAVLERNGMKDQKVAWRKFCYNSPEQRLRYNNMPHAVTAADAALNGFNFGQQQGGDVPQVWVEKKLDANGKPYLPIDKVLEMVNQPFLKAINRSFEEGFAMMMQYDQHSMWGYLTTVFTLGDMKEYYDPAMGAKSDLLPWAVASFLETSNVGTGMYGVSFVEMVIAVYDWGGSKDPYIADQDDIYMLTVDQGMQRFPDACRSVLDLDHGVLPADGELAQVQVGMLREQDGAPYSYNPPNLTPDAQPPGAARAAPPHKAGSAGVPQHKQRVFLRHQLVGMEHDTHLYDGHGGIKLRLRQLSPHGEPAQMIEKQYPYVITTLPNGAYVNVDISSNRPDQLSFAKAQALRQCEYMPAFKAFLTFDTQFWTRLGVRQELGYGAASTDRPNRQIIYPSYGYDGEKGVLQVYCWAQDARRLGALSDEDRVAECLKGIAYLYPEVDVQAQFSGYDDGKTTRTWYWDEHAAGGAFALFNAGQFKNMYAALLAPEFDGCLNFAGECCSVHHGWIVGALDSAYNAVYHILQQAGADDKIRQMRATWGSYGVPDIAADAATANAMDYAWLYNEADRKAASKAPGAAASIYGDSQFEFAGNVPAFVADFGKAPQTMKKTSRDAQLLQMLNDQWDENVAQRAKAQRKHARKPADPNSAVAMLEARYYGDNFQTIPAPRFWLKDDDEFARQQLAGFMPNLLAKVSLEQVKGIVARAGIPNAHDLGPLEKVMYVADYRRYLEACTVTPAGAYLAQPIVFFTVTDQRELMPLAIQLEPAGALFTPAMPNAANAWLLAKMFTNCAGQTLHDVGFHQLLTHQVCSMVSVALFSEEVFNPLTEPRSATALQQHPVFKLLAPHTAKALEFQQEIYNSDYDPAWQPFPATRKAQARPGVYNLGFVYDLIFSCGRIGNYQLQDKMYNDAGHFRFLDHAIPRDARKRDVLDTPFSYAYVHDASLWYAAMSKFVGEFVDIQYPGGDAAVCADVQLQRFFDKLIPAFNHVEGGAPAQRFPAQVATTALLKEVLTMFVWQFSVQHTVVNDGAYNHAAFVPNASTLMSPPPAGKTPGQWTAADVLACLPSEEVKYAQLGGMGFMDVQINASVTGQGPYPETILGRGVIATAIDVLQDTYAFSDGKLRQVVDNFYQEARAVGEAIAQRQAKDIARYVELHPDSRHVPETVIFDRITPARVMNAIQT